MYVGLLKFEVEVDEAMAGSWQKAAQSLCEKLRARFKVVAKPSHGESGDFSIVVVNLAGEHETLHQQFGKILDLAETSGIGRVRDERELIEALADWEDVENDDDWQAPR